MEKVTQEYVLEFIKKFILENQSLIQLDLTNTGLDEWGIVELVQLLKDTQELSAYSEPYKLRNLASLHMTCPDIQS